MNKNFLENLKDVGRIGLKTINEQRSLITEQWDKLGLLEGLEGNTKENCAVLFENQLNHMLTESTTSDNSGQYETVAFPIIRRIFSKLLANDIVSVQAQNLPLARLYYFNPTISVRSDGAHKSMDGAYQNAATNNDKVGFEEKSLYDSFYATEYDDEGDSLFDRTGGVITTVTGTTTNVDSYSAGDKSIRIKVAGFTTTNEGKLVGSTGAPMDTESFLSSLKVITDGVTYTADNAKYNKADGDRMDFNVSVQQYGKAIVNKNGELYLTVDLTYPGTDGYMPLSASTTPSFIVTYNTYSDMEEDSRMAEVSFKLDYVTVDVRTRKMRANWSPEQAQDVSAFHNIDAEVELTALLSEQMAAEIDREILRDLRRGAAWTMKWDYAGLRNQTNTYYGVQKDWNQTLITTVNKISAQIAKATLRGSATWLVVSPEISAVLDDLEYFHVSNASPDEDKYNMGIEKIGSVNGRYIVYRDNYAPANTMIIGHRGNSILETGYIYAPYVPMQLTPVLYNYNDFTSIRGIITRYAKKMVLNRYYGRVYVDNLDTFGIGELK